MTKKGAGKALMDEDGIRITAGGVKTPKGEFAFADIVGVTEKIHRPLWGPFLLASLGTLTLAAAVQTMFWGDWLAASVMLLGGIYWRIMGVRHVIVIETASKKVDAWYAGDKKQCDRALELLRRAVA